MSNVAQPANNALMETRPRKLTLAPLAAEYARQRRVRGEINQHTYEQTLYTLNALARSFGARNLSRLNTAEIDRFFEAQGDMAPGTRGLKVGYIKGFTRWLVLNKRLKNDPMTGYTRPPRPRRVPVTFTPDDVSKVFNVKSGDRRARAIVWLMVGCGLRCAEVSRLNLDDYDPRSRTLTRVVGKGGHERHVPVPANAAEAIDAYLNEVGRVDGPLIRSRGTRGKPGFDRLSEKTVSIYAGRWIREAGVKARAYDGKSAHGFRRTCASDVMDATRDLYLVQEMLGHADPKTTLIYVRRTEDAVMRKGMEGRNYEA